ncbi:MAG: zf-HC2 domain-containing protein [Syntrophomonadaceae bacterium]|jgi:hypothetical protein
MKCEQIRDLLSPYIDRVTTEEENRDVEAHIALCAECRQELEELTRIRQMFCTLDEPRLPDSFSHDLHLRLLEEQGKLFKSRDIKRPKRPGWIAVGIAGVALTIGIFSSHFLPVNTIMALWEDKTPKAEEKHKPSVAIDDIIRRICGGDENYKDPNEGVIIPGKTDPDLNIPRNEPGINNSNPNLNPPEETAPNDGPEESTETVKIEPKIADARSTFIEVESTNDSLAKVIQIASVNELDYTIMPNGKDFQALSGTAAKVISLKVDQEKIDDLLVQLSEVGQLSELKTEDIVLTQQYADIEKAIQALEQEKAAIESKADYTEEDRERLASINCELQDCLNQKAQFDEELNKITLTLYLSQKVRP